MKAGKTEFPLYLCRGSKTDGIQNPVSVCQTRLPPEWSDSYAAGFLLRNVFKRLVSLSFKGLGNFDLSLLILPAVAFLPVRAAGTTAFTAIDSCR